MGPIWGRQNPGGPHVGPMNFAIWDGIEIDSDLQWLQTHSSASTQSTRDSVKYIFSCTATIACISHSNIADDCQAMCDYANVV